MLIRTAILFPVLSIALAAPTLALAESEMHLSRGEVGYTFYPNHVKSTKTTAQVMQELQEAKADGSSHQYSLEEYPAPTKNVGPVKTRAEVLNELKNVTPAERARMQAIYTKGAG
jgi:hypothetical protein